MIQTDSLQLTHQSLEFFSQKTKDRILISSLVLFNERGFNNVTTASIAKHTGILEGTLWYHFNSKKDILSNHIQLLQKVFISVNQQNKSKDFETIINEFFQSYNIIWDFRYILRDNFQKYFEDDKSISKTITDINNYLDKWAENRMLHSQESGLIKINSKEIKNLSEITLVIGRYWLDFSMKKYPGVKISSLRLKGLKHIVTVLSPYLNPKGIPTIENMFKELK
ncbi:TetR/AcrR family transcriptional regulator [Flavobacteriaceae bacterium]|nr:TetR/AcrR family transcriptional regulator [Flavobacteriaceae bacterium]MDC1459534.1 TetR/AcrR family transcriptional regulator [Flavobacteriaceae bacterium]